MISFDAFQTSTLNLRVIDSHGVGWETQRIFLVARAVSQLLLGRDPTAERTQTIVLIVSVVMNDGTGTHKSERSDFLGRVDLDDLVESQFRLCFMEHLAFGEPNC